MSNPVRTNYQNAIKDPALGYATPADIEHKYNKEEFEKITVDPSFINRGQVDWKRDRAQWVRQVGDEEDDYEDFDEWLNDVDDTITQMRLYKPFCEPVPLTLMAELLEVIWVENPSL